MSAQSIKALAIANRTRSARADVLREIRSLDHEESPGLAAVILRDPRAPVEGIRLDKFLGSVNRYGPWRSGRLLVRAGLPPGRLSRRISELSERERHALAEALSPRKEPDGRQTRKPTNEARRLRGRAG